MSKNSRLAVSHLAPTSCQKIKVAVVDDHPLFRAGVTKSLSQSGMFEVVGEGATADEAVSLAREMGAGILLMDVRMPGNCVDAMIEIAQSIPAVKFVVLTALDDESLVRRCLDAGATGYILKGIAAAELAEALRSIAQGGGYISPKLAAQLLIRRRHADVRVDRDATLHALTPREEQILRGVTQGLSNREIGDRVNLSEKSVKHHMTSVLQKLQARNRVEAAVIARLRYTGDDSEAAE